MKTIRIYLPGDFQDGYLYGGQLFVVQNDGAIKSVALWDIISQNLRYKSEEYNFFRFVFSQNNWLKNEQATLFLKIPGFKENFDRLWEKFSKANYVFTANADNILKQLHQLDSVPTFDFKIYAMRMFLGNRNGLYETGFSVSDKNAVRFNGPLERVFDGRATNISTKSGSVMISSNSDGLFHGRLTGIGERLTVKETPVSAKSLRSAWSGYDVLNYESQNSFDYLKSEYSKTASRQYLYRDENESQKISIDNIGTEIYSSHELFNNSKIEEAEILYSFNSSSNCFMFMNDGSLKYLSFKKENKDAPVRLSSKVFNISGGAVSKQKDIRPISSKIIPSGCVIEYFDRVVLLQNNRRQILENNPVISVNTYANSIRYKNIITIFDGQGLAIHSVYPFEQLS